MTGNERVYYNNIARIADALEDIAKELKKHRVRPFNEMTEAVLNNMKNKVEASDRLLHDIENEPFGPLDPNA